MKKQTILMVLSICVFLSFLSETSLSQVDKSIFSDPSLKLKEIGKLKALSSDQIRGSSLSIGFETLDRMLFDPEMCYDKLAATGIKWARCQTGWNRCETVKGQYDFKWLDEVVDNLLKRGIQPWFNVGFGNKLYMPDAQGEAAVGWVPIYYGDEVLQSWGNYIKALAKHFKGRVKYYEIWNEPNVNSFWQPGKANAPDYFKLISYTSPIIKSQDKDAGTGACVSGSTSAYVLELIKEGVSEYIDFFSVHPYRIVPETGYQKEIESLRRMFDMNGGKHVQIWQGEVGYGSYFPTGHFLKTWHRGSETHQAKWLLRRFSLDVYLGLPVSSFFQMVDMNTKPYVTSEGKPREVCLHGILHGKSYEPKEAYYAARNFAAIFDEDTKPAGLFCSLNFEKQMPKTARVSRLTEAAAIAKGFLRNGYPLYLYYLPEDLQMGWPGMTDISVQTLNDAPKRMEHPVLIDLLSGHVFSIETYGNGWCKNLPLTDYPLLVTDIEALNDRIILY